MAQLKKLFVTNTANIKALISLSFPGDYLI